MQASVRPLSIQTAKSSCVHPYHFEKGKFIGGFASEDVLENARMPGIPSPRDIPLTDPPRPNRRYEGRYLFAGPLWNHFGHVLVDCIHRLWALLEKPDRYEAIVFANVQNLRARSVPQIPSFVPHLLDLMGLPAIPIIFVDEATEFEILDIPELGSIYKIGLSPGYRPYLERYQEAITKRTALFREKTPTRIFYGRGHALRDGGVIGSSYFEKSLKHAGFLSCVPEDLSLRLQFAYLLQAEEIIFEEGSSIHLTELLHEVKANVRILPRRPNPHVFRTALTPRCSVYQVLAKPNNIIQLPDRNGNMSPASLTFYKDHEAVYNELSKIFDLPDFDKSLYETLELRDLKAAPVKSPTILKQRLNMIRNYREET
ncbi:glycosyltransferase family 61 protein [Sphingobium soli]|jgi:hypothetical protein|uniref:Glycosyltransferase family 61 protein n=1 Tax=Sphingobium soli TaxID=1591116 RepID=A0ABS8GYC0_9SPHN|nr:glycosyltransferase 61 family protein [Sphingobium soli]MCC4231103.1 glycosyltransferase family 61 protein [Sphingobium soli]